uniref:Uncharacterized protein n=1 Tax=Rhizophora mucronata TaxID=61149 RepID=A0A2P2NXI3_RHIMU
MMDIFPLSFSRFPNKTCQISNHN